MDESSYSDNHYEKTDLISFSAGAVPNSDKLLDTLIGLKLYYGYGITSFSYLNSNRAGVLETETDKKTTVSSEKIYDVTVWKLPERKFKYSFLYLSTGFGYRYSTSENNISGVYTTMGGRLFTDEKRTSIFHQPYITVSVAAQPFSCMWLGVRSKITPYMFQDRTTVIAKSSENENFTNSGRDKGLQIEATGYAEFDYDSVKLDMSYSFYRRLFSTTIDNGGSSGHIFETVNSQDTIQELGLKVGLKFLGDSEKRSYPTLFVSRYYQNTMYLAESIKNDQTIKENGWKLGIIINMGEVE